jgi:hypothetical protein
MVSDDKWCPENDGAYRAEMVAIHWPAERRFIRSARAEGYRAGLDAAAKVVLRCAWGEYWLLDGEKVAPKDIAAIILGVEGDTP